MPKLLKPKAPKNTPKQKPGALAPASAEADDSDSDYNLAVPERVREAIAAERDNLCKVESLLSCLFVSLQERDHPFEEGPYFPPVAQLARELVARTINGLDPTVLESSISLKNRMSNVPGILKATRNSLDRMGLKRPASSRASIVKQVRGARH